MIHTCRNSRPSVIRLLHWLPTLPRSSIPKTTRQPEISQSLPLHCAQLALKGRGTYQRVKTLRLSASRSRVLACPPTLIQPHLHTMRPSQPTSASSSREPSLPPRCARTPHTLNTKFKILNVWHKLICEVPGLLSQKRGIKGGLGLGLRVG